MPEKLINLKLSYIGKLEVEPSIPVRSNFIIIEDIPLKEIFKNLRGQITVEELESVARASGFPLEIKR